MTRTLLTFLIIGLIFFGMIPPTFAQETAISHYTKEQLEQAENLAQKAFEAMEKDDLKTAENYWSALIKQFPENPAVWSNRGNVRIGENQIEAAIADFNKAIEIAPDFPDPYLNRAVGYEFQGKWTEAIKDYNKVLTIDPNDAMAYNNRGNAKAGLGNWQDAIADYQKAVDLEADFAFAKANLALGLYQVGNEAKSLEMMRDLVLKYQMFPDMRAALTAVLWEQGKQGEAQSNWVAAMGLDARYQDLTWVKDIRRWPPKMVAALENFLKFQE
jgi:tetratricopeptide (TPR) repeat protein